MAIGFWGQLLRSTFTIGAAAMKIVAEELMGRVSAQGRTMWIIGGDWNRAPREAEACQVTVTL